MPWSTPTLRKVREMVRDDITASLYGAAFIGNNVLRVMADAKAGLAHHVLRYIDWLSLQQLPDTAETEWLDRHGDIWLVGPGGVVGRKMATYATGSVTFTGIVGGIVIPMGTRLEGNNLVAYETIELAVTQSDGAAVEVRVRALDAGTAGNREAGDTLSVQPAIDGVTTGVTVVTLTGGTDIENDDDLRMRVLQRIRQPPQGGSTSDFIRWGLSVPGVTRCWCAPLEMGIGTVTVRCLFDDLRADNDGWPRGEDLYAVETYIDSVRPVAVKDFWVLAPVKQFVDVHLGQLNPDTTETRAAIEASLHAMFMQFAAPGQTIFAAWKAQAVMNTPGVLSVDLLDWNDDVMQSPGHMGVIADIVYGF